VKRRDLPLAFERATKEKPRPYGPGL